MNSHTPATPGAFDDQRKTISSNKSRRGLEKIEIQDNRIPRGKMAPGAHKALRDDIQALYEIAHNHKVGAMKFQ